MRTTWKSRGGDELQPRSRPRALALAKALSGFPVLNEGGSLLEYILSFELFVTEYEVVSTQKYQEYLKISTLHSGSPQDVKCSMYMYVNDTATYFECETTSCSTRGLLRGRPGACRRRSVPLHRWHGRQGQEKRQGLQTLCRQKERKAALTRKVEAKVGERTPAKEEESLPEREAKERKANLASRVAARTLVQPSVLQVWKAWTSWI